MQVTVETRSDISSLTRTINFGVLIAEVQATTQKQLQKISKTANIKGFRPGKVPFNIIEKQYGRTAFDEALNEQVGNAFYKAVNELQLKVIGEPAIEPSNTNSTEDELAFKGTFEVYPTIEFGDFKAMPLETFQVEITPEHIDETIDLLRKQRASYAVTNAPAQIGDKLKCNFEGTIDGVAFEGGSATDFSFELGASRMLPEFETAALGLKSGDVKTFDLTFPDDYPGEAVKGKTAHFTLTAIAVETPVLPALDSEFAKKMGFDNGDIEAFKNDVKSNVEREIKGRMRQRSKEAAFDSLLANTTFDAPKALVDDECAVQKKNFQQYMKQQGVNDLKASEFPLEMFAERSIKRVKLGLALGALLQKESLKPTPQQVRQRIEEISASYQKPEEVAAWYFGSRERLDEVEAVVIEDNAVDWLIAHCNSSVKHVPFKEAMLQNQTA